MGNNENSLTLIPLIFPPKMLSAYYVCCIYSKVLKTSLISEANTMNPDQTAPNLVLREQSDLGQYCLQYSLPMYSADDKCANGGKRVKALTYLYIKVIMLRPNKKISVFLTGNRSENFR